MLALSRVALAGAALAAFPLLAEESPPPPPPAPDTPSSAPPSEPFPEPRGTVPTAKEIEELTKALGGDAAQAATTSVPDLSKVNLAAGIPGVQSLNPDMSIILDVAGAAFGAARSSTPGSPLDDTPLMTGGHDPTENGFTLRQVELSFSASVDPFLRFDSNLVIKDELEVEEAYVTTLALPFNLQGRAGEFLSKFGRQNEKHPHSWWFISQPLVYGQMMGEDDFRGLGAEVSWLSPLPWSLVVVGAVQQASGSCCSLTFSPDEAGPPVTSPLDLVATGVVEQFFPLTDDLSLLWGLSAMTGPTAYIDPGARGELWGTDVFLRYQPVASDTRWFIELQAEGMLRTRHPTGSDFFAGATTDGGAYTQLIWHPNPEMGVGARYDTVYAFADDVASANGGLGPETQRAAIVAEYAPTHFSRIQAELNAGTRGQGDLLWGAMINLEVAVGAHGAHAY